MTEKLFKMDLPATPIDVLEYTESIDAPPGHIVEALTILSKQEFNFWVALCSYHPGLPPRNLRHLLDEHEMKIGKSGQDYYYEAVAASPITTENSPEEVK